MDKFVLEKQGDQLSEMYVDDERIVFTETMNVDSLLDENRREQNQIGRSHGDLQRVASLDMVTYMKLQREGVLKDKKAFMKWLDDPDNRAFRTNTMGLSRAKSDGKIIVK